jgi:hypothetical protein
MRKPVSLVFGTILICLTAAMLLSALAAEVRAHRVRVKPKYLSNWRFAFFLQKMHSVMIEDMRKRLEVILQRERPPWR